MDTGFALFATRLGRCGICWSPKGIEGLQLPEPDDEDALRRLERRFPSVSRAAPPPNVQRLIEAICGFLAGRICSRLDGIELNLDSVGAWERQVYGAARAIPVGSILTYGQLAAQLGDPRKARAVGQALGRNPWPILVPCHRITAAGGAIGGFSAPGGRRTKLRLLEIEGALAPRALPLFAERHH
jgi:methylated-DNA-[protein]-cysteine S-methyltransferase